MVTEIKTYQFTCAVTLNDGYNIEINGLVTPAVEAMTPTQAFRHPDIVQFCNENKCSVYREVNK